MTDRDLERRLGDWLDEQAPRAVPPGLRSVLASLPAQTESTRRGFRSRWTVATALIVMVILLTAALTLSLLGLNPRPPADCSRVSFEGVRAALIGISGYSYELSGTELSDKLARPFETPPEDRYDHTEVAVAARGAYVAPGNWRFQVIDGPNQFGPLPPPESLPLFFAPGRSFVYVDGELWSQPWLTPFYVQPAHDPFVATMGPNVLADLMVGTEWQDGGAAETPYAWEVSSDGDMCALHGTISGSAAGDPAAVRSVELRIDPDTLLPSEVVSEWISRPPANTSIWLDEHLTWQIDTNVPVIDSPSDVTPRPLTTAELEEIGPQLRLVNPQLAASQAEGVWQAVIIRGDDRVAEVVLNNGLQASILTVTADAGLAVDLNEPTAASRFLFVIVGDPRVARVQIDLASVPDETVEVEPGTEATLIRSIPANAGLNGWTAFDASGNELPELGPPH